MDEAKQEKANSQEGKPLDEEDELLGEEEQDKGEVKDGTSELEKKLKAAEEEAAKWKNAYYTTLADTQNLRKSLEEDHRNALRYRSEGFLGSLIPALDSFHIALEATPNGEEAKNYRIGFQYIYNQIKATLEREGVSEIAPKEGDRFDATSMHAVDLVEGGEEGKVAKVLAKGYRLYDRMIRPAMVSVYGKKADDKKEEQASEAAKPSEA